MNTKNWKYIAIILLVVGLILFSAPVVYSVINPETETISMQYSNGILTAYPIDTNIWYKLDQRQNIHDSNDHLIVAGGTEYLQQVRNDRSPMNTVTLKIRRVGIPQSPLVVFLQPSSGTTIQMNIQPNNLPNQNTWYWFSITLGTDSGITSKNFDILLTSTDSWADSQGWQIAVEEGWYERGNFYQNGQPMTKDYDLCFMTFTTSIYSNGEWIIHGISGELVAFYIDQNMIDAVGTTDPPIFFSSIDGTTNTIIFYRSPGGDWDSYIPGRPYNPLDTIIPGHYYFSINSGTPSVNLIITESLLPPQVGINISITILTQSIGIITMLGGIISSIKHGALIGWI